MRILCQALFSLGLMVFGMPSANAFLFMDGGTCIPGTIFNNTCLQSNFYSSQPGGLTVIPVISADGNSISGTLDDQRFAFTTGSTAFLTGSANLATGQLKVQANSIEGTSHLFAALRTAMGDTVHLSGPTDADGIADGLYTITLDLHVHAIRTTDFTDPQSIIFQSFIDVTLLRDSSHVLCENPNPLLPNVSGGVGDIINETVSVQCAVPANFLFSVELASGRVSDGFFDAGSTATLSLGLPTGVTFTSDSGVLLSEVNTPGGSAPEPATLALLGIGLAGLGFSRGTQRRTALHRAA